VRIFGSFNSLFHNPRSNATNQFGSSRLIDLLAETIDVDVDQVGLTVVMAIPNLLENSPPVRMAISLAITLALCISRSFDGECYRHKSFHYY
jgi:hypothetical protein